MATSPLPTEAELAKARLLIARSDQANRKSKKPKGTRKGTAVDQENKDPGGEAQVRRKKSVVAVA